MILTSLNRFRDLGLLVLRVGLGAMFIYHGLPKLLAGPALWAQLGTATGTLGIHFLPVFWGFLSAAAEGIGGLLLLLGLLSKPACLLMFINMVVAASFHLGKGDGLGIASHAIEVGIVFLSLVLIGPGRYSLDEVIRPSKSPKP
jgi:putative oxidoreductase